MKQIIDKFNEEALEGFLQSITLSDFSKLPRQHVIMRMPYGNERAYHTVDQGRPRLLSGITSVTKKIAKAKGFPDILGDWKIKVGLDAADEIAHNTSNLGTFMHIICSELTMVYQKDDPDYFVAFDEFARELFVKTMQNVGVSPSEIPSYWKRVVKGAISWNNFLHEYDLDIQAIEFPVVDFDKNIATPLDIIAYAGKDRALCNFNIKFREKANTYETDGLQVCAEQYIFNKYVAPVSGEKIERTYIVIPKSHPQAKTECLVKDYTGYYSEASWDEDIDYMMRQDNYKGIFFPDMTKPVTNVANVTIGRKVTINHPPRLDEFILSYETATIK